MSRMPKIHLKESRTKLNDNLLDNVYCIRKRDRMKKQDGDERKRRSKKKQRGRPREEGFQMQISPSRCRSRRSRQSRCRSRRRGGHAAAAPFHKHIESRGSGRRLWITAGCRRAGRVSEGSRKGLGRVSEGVCVSEVSQRCLRGVSEVSRKNCLTGRWRRRSA